MDVQFGKLAVGDKFLVRNYVSGEVQSDCPIREKIVLFQYKPGRTVNTKYEVRSTKTETGVFGFCMTFTGMTKRWFKSIERGIRC